MTETICINRTFLFMLMITLILICVYQYKVKNGLSLFFNSKCSTQECPIQSCPKQECPHSEINIIEAPKKPIDIVRDYDYKKAFDPLEDPTKRIERQYIQPWPLRPYFDIPTRGSPDNYRQVGILVNDSDDDKNNKILRLYGRQEFPNSNKYEYYTAINVGNDQVKIPLDLPRNKELYDDDTVTISEIGSTFKVKILKYDSPRYYPNF